MSSAVLELDQTLHGYDNGHRLLAASLQLEPRDERALLSMSDLSGPRAVENFLDYLTGYMLPGGSHYAVAKTWYATEMERPGCVWTHTFLIPKESIRDVRTLHFVQDKFFRPRLRSGYRYADKLAVSSDDFVKDDSADSLGLADDSILCGIEALYSSSDSMVALLATSGRQYEELSLRLWSQLWAEVRTELSFCTGSLSKRSLQGKPLVLQFGPDRIVRDMRNRSFEQCPPSMWVHALVQDLERKTPLRQFLSKNGSGLSSLSDTSRLVRIFLNLREEKSVDALALLVPNDFDSAIPLVQTVLRDAERQLPPLPFLTTILSRDIPKSAGGLPEILIPAIQRSLAVAQVETTEFLAERLRTLGVRNRKIIVSSLAEFADVDFVVFLSDAHPDLYQAVIYERMDLCYLPSLWSSSISLVDKIDLFDSVRNRDGVNKRRLFDAILDSQDIDLSAEVVGQLSEKDVAVTLEWLVEGDWTVALRPQWISYLRRYQDKVLAWGNNHDPSRPLLVILANVIDFRSAVIPDFSKKATLGLASVAGPLIRERHEVAAFVYVTTTYVNEPVAASYCVAAFAILHAAIAESRLSNRAWQILEQNLMPLTSERWDACEKLRRAILHFISLRRWPLESLWNLISGNTDLFHDFIRTAKTYDPGRSFFSSVRDKGVQGEFNLTKQQYKEIKKLLR
jgi:hypothetical protein